MCDSAPNSARVKLNPAKGRQTSFRQDSSNLVVHVIPFSTYDDGKY